VQRVPATEKSGRIHTSTVTVAVLPQPEEVQSEDTLAIWYYGVYGCTTVLLLANNFRMFRPLLQQTVLEFAEVYIVLNYYCSVFAGGPGSVVGIETGYGLDGPGIESQWGRDFRHLSRPALGPTQPPVQWALCLSGRQRAARA
jgi:hypothetical protein